MRFLILLMKQIKFWLLLLALVVGLGINFYFFNHMFDAWDDLPPLPNGETARSLTDVLTLNRINVLTDQGNYYSCSYHTLDPCWKAIPREVNHPRSINPGIVLPIPPIGTRQVVSHYQPIYNYSVLVLVAIIRSNGQVSFWEGLGPDEDWAFHYVCEMACGGIIVFPFLALISFIRATQKRLRIELNEDIH